ncbi:MAG: FtsW/RodA/SpoVE family cell cycle protein [Clostridia bacterium]|nr:FtsW/RodA/SpoVE family cell cycle protein [Clostridia bacterium]
MTFILQAVSGLCFVAAAACVLVSLFSYKEKLTNLRASLKNPSGGKSVVLRRREVSVGKAKTNDVVLNAEDVSRDHAVLCMRKNNWYVCDTYSKAGTKVNGETINGRTQIYDGDRLSFGSVSLIFDAPDNLAPAERLEISNDGSLPVSKRKKAELERSKIAAQQRREQLEQIKKRRRRENRLTFKAKHSHARFILSGLAMLFATVFQLINGYTVLKETYSPQLFICLAGIFALEWVYFFFNTQVFRRRGEIEILAFLFTSVGMMITGSVYPERVVMQGATALAGFVFFVFFGWFASDLQRVNDMRIPVGAGCLLLLAATLVVGTTVNGAKNWIFLGSFSIQPSEFAKVAFIYVGAATLEKLQSARSITLYTVFAVACVGLLFLMRDFGTALIFFATYVFIAFMRSGDFKTIFFVCAAAALGAVLILYFKSYILQRFEVYRHVWDDMNDAGYQQTRTLIYSASGGLFGVGPGRGELRGIFAATEDLVFGMLCEEFGMVTAFTVPVSYCVIALCCAKKAKTSMSAFYTIASICASGMILVQTALNVFGVTDFLPLTGVTLPLLSRGGSSMAATWGLLAFIKLNNSR